ncbi:long-chain-fatty-acid--CoA ligase [Nocardia asteroides]|uniref:long-chain-fatty-acid--CoA ligase n=1 Tax=Nocardia asteroides TaxID=1824 RepID=UPI001E53C5A5|nr:long-chain-fatty-acid--CoA ligase [Nocardia asteroides]UGT55106.1 long-chain-fatty-acid--CoA ligase [Nocardia asteroides]
MTMSDVLARHARKTPDQVAVRFLGESHTYSELDGSVNRLANALLERGVRRGDRIAVLTLNNPETVEAFHASARIGATTVPVNFRLVADEMAYILNDSEASVIIVDEALAPVAATACAQVPSLRHGIVIGSARETGMVWESYDHVLSTSSAAEVRIEVDEDSPALIMYTSGTTGRPKGAVLTHYNLAMHTASLLIHLAWPRDFRVWLAATPLFHIAGVAAVLPALFRGDTVVISRMGAFDAGQIIELLEHERVNVCTFVPAQWQMICDFRDIDKHDLSALRSAAWGAAPATPALLHKIMEVFPGVMLYSMFGQTETSPVTTVLMGEDALRKVGSIGTPLLNVEVRIVDVEMNDVTVGEVGEIVYRAPTVMKEYWNNPSATAAAFEGGWFHSGDLVRRDEEGYIYVVDRLKDMIISGGENVYCAEVENVVADHPKVAEVAVIGVPDDRWGEVALAVVVPRNLDDPLSVEELDRWCRARLAVYKRPKRLTTVDVLPRNASGKVLKTDLRTMFESC